MSSPSLVLTKDQQQVLNAGFLAEFGRKPERYFSAPGRTEIGGNHTDHQRGRVLAAAVNLDTQAAVAVNGTREVRILSKGYPLCVVSLDTWCLSRRKSIRLPLWFGVSALGLPSLGAR